MSTQALYYFTRIFSEGMDDAKSYENVEDAIKAAKKVVKGAKGVNPHAVIMEDGSHVATVQLSKTRRLQVKRR